MPDPSLTTVGESFNGGTGGNTNLSQTFTVPSTTYTLQTISLYAGAGTGTGAGTNLTLRLFDLGVQASNPDPYTGSIIGGNLLGAGAGLPVTYTPQANGIVQFDFTGADQVDLFADHLYAFELTGALGTQPMFWQRRTSDTYAGGAAYRNQAGVIGVARDFALAVYGVPSTNVAPPAPGRCTVNWNDTRQRIDGFGASSAWRPSMTATVADRYFSTNTGIGLSFLRTRIAPGGTTVENQSMQLARDRGARIWSAPWSPAVQFKDNGNVNGGNFIGNASNYQAYASQLATYVVNMKNQYNVTLYALSVQNEPDANVTTYEACKWTAQQIHDFIPYLSATLAASNVGATKIMLPESQNWTDPGGLRNTTLNDASVAPLVSIVANHNYVPDNNNGDQSTPFALNSVGKALWETEVSTFSAYDPGITNGIYWAKRIHAFLTVAQANAWHYWWLNASDNSGIASSADILAKRGYVLGQYSRFVRPDYFRVGVVTNLGAAQVSAFKEPGASNFAIVAINPTGGTINQTFTLTNFGVVSTVTPWITSAGQSLANQSSVPVTNSAFNFQLPAMSVVTFVGKAISNAPPSLAPVPDQTTIAGATLSLTNVALDPNVPPQVLTFSLLTNPPGATLGSTNGVFTWRPPMSSVGSTNRITVKVRDDGAPGLSATNTFFVRVLSPAAPVFESVTANNDQLTLLVNGDVGPDYSLFTSTNLFDWEFLLTTNPTTLPMSIAVTNSAEPQRFFRIQLGP